MMKKMTILSVESGVTFYLSEKRDNTLGLVLRHSPEDLDLLSGCFCVSSAAVILKLAVLSSEVLSW